MEEIYAKKNQIYEKRKEENETQSNSKSWFCKRQSQCTTLSDSKWISQVQKLYGEKKCFWEECW